MFEIVAYSKNNKKYITELYWQISKLSDVTAGESYSD